MTLYQRACEVRCALLADETIESATLLSILNDCSIEPSEYEYFVAFVALAEQYIRDRGLVFFSENG